MQLLKLNSRLKKLLLSVVVLCFISYGMIRHRETLSEMAKENGKAAHSMITSKLSKNKEDIHVDGDKPLWVNLQSPTNSTLGFQTIQYINLGFRYDRDDSISLQASVSGLTPEKFEGVDGNNMNKKGTGPQSVSSALSTNQIACFRSHANLWRKMIEENWSTMLVLEADATWDLNVRANMQRFATALNELLKKSPGAKARGEATENDPYFSEAWDMISLGHCFDGKENYEDHLIYKDIDAQERQDFFGRKLNGERGVRRSGSPTCTTAYALSQKGARKLLLRGALDYNRPVDLAIANLVISDQIISYSAEPVIFGQLCYQDGLGLDNKNSDVNDRTNKEVDYDDYKDKWKKVHKNRNVWDMSGVYKYYRFKQPAFEVLNKIVYEGVPMLQDKSAWFLDEPPPELVQSEEAKKKIQEQEAERKKKKKEKQEAEERKKKEEEEKKKEEEEEKKKKKEEEEEEEERKKQEEEENKEESSEDN